MAVTADAEINDGETVVARTQIAQYFIVAIAEDDRLWVVRHDAAGWVARSAVLPLTDAVEHFTRLVDQDASAENYAYRAMAYIALNEYLAAAADLTEAIRLGSDDPRYYDLRADALAMQGDFEQAIDDLDHAIMLDPAAPAYYDARGDLWRDLGEHERAIDDYSQIMRLDPSYFSVLLDRGLCWTSLKKYEQALTDINGFIERAPEQGAGYFYRGLVHQARGADQEAIVDYGRAVELDPEQPDFANALAWILATCPTDELRDGERAVEWATRACEASEWANYWWIDTLAAAHAETGDFAKAVEMQEKAITLGPEERRAELLARLELYQAGKPFRAEPPQ